MGNIKYNKYGIKLVPGEDLYSEHGSARLFGSYATATWYQGINQIPGVVVEVLPNGKFKFISNNTGPKVA